MYIHLFCFGQLLSHIQLFVTPWTAAHQAFLSLSVSWSLLKLMSIESIIPSKHFILYCLLLFLLSVLPSIRAFPVSWLFTSQGQSIETSASVLVPPMSSQGWFPLGLTSLLSLLLKWLSRIFSSTTVQKHQFFSSQLMLGAEELGYIYICVCVYVSIYIYT